MARKLTRHQKKIRDDKRRKLEKLANRVVGGQELRASSGKVGEVAPSTPAAAEPSKGRGGITLFEDLDYYEEDCRAVAEADAANWPIGQRGKQRNLGRFYRILEKPEINEDYDRMKVALELLDQLDRSNVARRKAGRLRTGTVVNVQQNNQDTTTVVGSAVIQNPTIQNLEAASALRRAALGVADHRLVAD